MKCSFQMQQNRPIGHRRRALSAPASSSTSPPPSRRGSTRCGGSANCSCAAWSAACSARSTSLRARSRTGSRSGTTTPALKWTKTAGEVAKCPASSGAVPVACSMDQKVRATYPTLSRTRTYVRTLMLHGKMPAPRCWGRDAGILPVELRLRQRVVVSQHEAASAHLSEQRFIVGPQVRANLRHRGPQRGI